MRLMDILAHAKDTPSQNIRLRVHNLPITIEHPKGTLRELHDDKGNLAYKQHMSAHYGFFNGTKGRDGDEVDCFVGPFLAAKEVYIVHMLDKGPVKAEREDEDKCFLQYPSADAAKKAFTAHYPEDFYGGMTALPVDVFKKKLKEAQLPHRKKKITASKSKCPHCGHKKYGLMPTDYETAKCAKCGKTWEINAQPVGHIRPMPVPGMSSSMRKR